MKYPGTAQGPSQPIVYIVPRVLSARNGQAHALYLQGRSPTTLQLNLAKDRWTAEWISVENGAVLRRETFKAAKPPTALHSSGFLDAVALRLKRE